MTSLAVAGIMLVSSKKGIYVMASSPTGRDRYTYSARRIFGIFFNPFTFAVLAGLLTYWIVSSNTTHIPPIPRLVIPVSKKTPANWTFSPDGKLLGVLFVKNRPEGKFWWEVQIYNVISGEAISWKNNGDLDIQGRLEFSPDSRSLVVYNDNEIRVFEVATGQCLKKWNFYEETNHSIQKLVFTSDSRPVIVIWPGRDVPHEFLDLGTGKRLFAIDFVKDKNHFFGVSFTPSVKGVVYVLVMEQEWEESSSSPNNQKIISLKVVNLDSGTIKKEEIITSKPSCLSCKASSNLRYLFLVGYDRKNYVWDTEGRVFKQVRPNYSITELLPDGNVLVGSGRVDQKTMYGYFWDVEKNQEITRIYQIYGFQFSPDGKVFAAIGDDNTIQIFDYPYPLVKPDEKVVWWTLIVSTIAYGTGYLFVVLKKRIFHLLSTVDNLFYGGKVISH